MGLWKTDPAHAQGRIESASAASRRHERAITGGDSSMADTADYDQIAKAVAKMVDDWGKAIGKIAKQLADVQDQIEKMDALIKQREGLTKDADSASKDLSNKIFTLKIPPKADPQQMLKLPDFITKIVDKNGVKIGDYGSVKPDIDLDIKKMQFKKVGITWTWSF
jgi:TolA-binding protein